MGADTSDKVGYLLARDHQASARLNLQAFLWQSIIPTATGLHPKLEPCVLINSSTSDPIAVADVATGTGIFLTLLSQRCQDSVTLHGFDISSAQYPHSSFLPANVKLFAADARGEPAEEFRGRYDIVHIRLLVAAVDGNDPRLILQYAKKLLKPGGMLQWDELDPWARKRVPWEPNTVGGILAESWPNDKLAPCCEQLAVIFRDYKQTTWIADLARHFKDNGFRVEADDVYHPPDWQKQLMMENWLLVANEYMSLKRAHGRSAESEEVKQLIHGAAQEAKLGVYYAHEFRVVVGRA